MLKRALYGLKQAPRAWYARMDAYLQRLGFTKSSDVPNLYIKVVKSEYVIILMYVDDLLLIDVTGCWARDTPGKVLGLRAQILVKDCNSDVKTSHFLGVERVVCKRVIGLSTLNFVIVMLAIEIYPWSTDHGIV